ncbi:hypothetical protein M9Y10_015864 [Tritrichomonas musculus]|uniref:Myb-like DNA-binding domain containing protein n=1 Tax=Tritrichomonas musculus TaxID=1915356 RepID=A0ABR2I4T2_9EUKA
MQLSFPSLPKIGNQCNSKKNQLLLSNLKIPKNLQLTYKSLISKICDIKLQNKKLNNNFLFNANQVKKSQLGFLPQPNGCFNPMFSYPYNNLMNKNQQMGKAGKKSRIPFTKEEDEKIKQLVQKYGCRQWQLISSFIPGRSPKQCRDRYSNYLIPGLKSGQWLPNEDELLTKLYNDLGPKWSRIQKYFPGRSTNSIKNRWNYFLCRQNNDHPNTDDNEFSENNMLNEDDNENDDLNFNDYFSLNGVSTFAVQTHNELDESSLNNDNEDSYSFIDQVNEILKNVENGNDNGWIII